MSNTIVNYDGSIVTSRKQVVFPETVEEIQAILRDSARYPSPVRAMGSYHSLTPCVSSTGTIVRISRMTKITGIDVAANTFTANRDWRQSTRPKLCARKTCSSCSTSRLAT